MRTITSLLFYLVAITVISSANADHHTQPFTESSRVALSAYRGMVEEHIAGIQRALRVVALSQEAQSGSWERMQPMLKRFSDDLPTDATTWFVNPEGGYFTTDAEGLKGESLKDRHYFPDLISGKEVFGELVISKSTGHRSVIVAVPVKSGDKVLGGLGVSVRVRLLSEFVAARLPLPPDQYFYALERDTRIAIHSRAERMFMTPSDVGDEALGEEFKKTLQRERGEFNYVLHGDKIASVYELSPTLGWYFFIAKK
jgi:methyl-accepting chemotaxis protein